MKLSSLDIRKQEFTRVVRGYDKDEVDAFLQLVANQWQEVIDDYRREEEKTKELNFKLEHYQKVEEALEEALKTARDSAKLSIDNAEHKARLIVEEAEAQSVGITRDSEKERLDIRKDAARYSVRQKEIVAKLRAFLMSELEILARYESDAPANYAKLMPAELVEDLSRPEQEFQSIQDLIPNEETDLDDVEEVLDENGAEQTEEGEAVVVDQVMDTSDSKETSGAKNKKTSKERKSKDPEVSDEIEKIRRILEDLEK